MRELQSLQLFGAFTQHPRPAELMLFEPPLRAQFMPALQHFHARH